MDYGNERSELGLPRFGGLLLLEDLMPGNFEQPMLIDEPERFRVFSYGEWVGTYKTAKEVWEIIKGWDVGQERVYDDDRITTREAVEKEALG